MIFQFSVKLKTSNEAGVVSIITVVLLAMVLTLITTAFVKSTNSNQRQALDNQLSTQAFYAAETGINDVTTLIKKGIVTDTTATSDCTTFMGIINANKADIGRDFGLGGSPSVLNSSSNIEYTCVMVTSKAPNIQIDAEVGQGYIYPVRSVDGNVIDKLKIKWGGGQTTATSSGSELPTKNAWRANRKALIRLTFYYPSAMLSRADLIANQRTFFLKPVSSGGATSLVGTSADGTIAEVACASDECDLEISNINVMTGMIPANNRALYIRVEPIYSSAPTVTIEAYSGGLQQNLAGAQYVIDVTGRANDVYRRLEVRRKIEINWGFPDDTVQTGGDLCKQFEVWPGAAPTDVGASASIPCPTF